MLIVCVYIYIYIYVCVCMCECMCIYVRVYMGVETLCKGVRYGGFYKVLLRFIKYRFLS